MLPVALLICLRCLLCYAFVLRVVVAPFVVAAVVVAPLLFTLLHLLHVLLLLYVVVTLRVVVVWCGPHVSALRCFVAARLLLMRCCCSVAFGRRCVC